MKRLLHRIALLSVTAALSVSLAFPAAATVYLDVKTSDWFSPAVDYVVRKGLFTAVAPNWFGPRQAMSRGMFYTVLSRVAGVPVDDAVSTNLTDVPAGKWYTGAVIWAISSGIADCRSADAFGVQDEITRSELCLALARYDRLTAANALPAGVTPSFPDMGGLDAEQCAAIAACQSAGVIQGRENGLFDPHAGANRAEVAQMVRNFCQLPEREPLADVRAAAKPWDTVSGWTGEAAADFPLAAVDSVDQEQVLWLNTRILNENYPAAVAPYGQSADGNPKHLTNYGDGGSHDCYNVSTILLNKNNNVDIGEPLAGRQEYYGYSLQTTGIARQDRWHQAAQDSGKDPWQCTWWVWGRAAQYLELTHGLDLKALCNDCDNLGHGKDYYRNLKSYFYSDQTPSANSIVSWSAGAYGHVAYVEAADDNGIWVSMADSGHTWRGVTYIVKTDSAVNPYPLYWYPSETLNGFNHLDFAADGSPIA